MARTLTTTVRPQSNPDQDSRSSDVTPADIHASASESEYLHSTRYESISIAVLSVACDTSPHTADTRPLA